MYIDDVYRRLIDMNRTTYRELQMACDHRLVKDTQVHCQKKQQKQEQRRQEQEQSPHELRDRLVESIVLAIFNNGGRFLKNHRSTGMWVEISFKEAIGVEQRQNYGHSEQENYWHSEAQLGSY